jgi:peptidyl-prolyl cis-trans isomerase D
MLKQLSRLKHTRNILILGFVLFMAVSLVIFYRPGSSGNNLEPSKNTAVVAKVNGDDITVSEVAQIKDNYMQMFGGQISLSQLGGTKRFLDGLIRDRVVSQEAARLGLAASEKELKDRLVKQFTDPSGKFVFADASGKIDVNKYKESVTARYGDVERFERGVRDSIAQEKLRAFVTASVSVSPEEVQEDFKHKNVSFDLTYVAIGADKLAEKIQPSDQDLRAYYEQHKTDYRLLEPQKKIRYLYIDQAKAGEKLQIADKDLHEEFDRLSPENKQSGVKVQQILLKVARKDLDAQVEQKAKDLIVKLRGTTGQATEKAFADMARGNSEDPATAAAGGFLPHPVKKNPNKPDALYERAVDLNPGDVTDVPIKYAGNYYILRRGESVPKTFEEAKPELLVSSRNRRGYAVAAGLAQRAQESLKKSHDVQKVAQELAAEANMKPADMVRETPFIKSGDDVPNIGSNQQFEAAIAPLINANDVGDRTGVKGGFAVPMLVDKKEPRVPDFDEVKDKVAQAFKQQRAKEQLDQKARELAAAVNSAGDLKAAAEKAGLEVATEESYGADRTLGKVGTSQALDQALYGLKEGEVTKSPIKVGDSWVIAGVTKRKEADLAVFAAKREQLTETALKSRQDQVYEDYIGAAVAKLKRDGKIKIYQDVLDTLDEEEPQVAPQAPPRRPRVPVNIK